MRQTLTHIQCLRHWWQSGSAKGRKGQLSHGDLIGVLSDVQGRNVNCERNLKINRLLVYCLLRGSGRREVDGMYYLLLRMEPYGG